MRRTAAAQAAVMIAGLLTTLAPVAQAGPRQELAGTTQIQGSRTSYVEVKVPRPASLSTKVSLGRSSGPNPDVSIQGKGPFVGVVLVPDPLPADPAGAALVAGRFSTCSGPACPSGRGPINYISSGPEKKGGHEIPAGDYRLYLIADEGSASVTLRLDGLGGKTRLTPRTEAPGLAYAPEVRKDINTGGAYYGAGKYFDGGTAGVAAQAMFFSSEDFRGADYGSCLYRGPVLPPEQSAFGVQCSALSAPGGESEMTSVSGDGDPERMVITSQSSWSESHLPSLTGERGAGVFYRSAGAIQNPGSQAFYLSFDDAAALPDRSSNTTYKGGRRTTSWHYEGPAIGASGLGVCTHPIHACAIFLTNTDESLIDVVIEDAAGLPVNASISQSIDGGPLETVGSMCGETEEALPITPGAELIIFPWAVGRTSCPGAATTGEVIVTFSN